MQVEVTGVFDIKGRGLVVNVLPVTPGRINIGDLLQVGYHSWRITGVEMTNPMPKNGAVGILLKQETGTGVLVKGEKLYVVRAAEWRNLERPGYFGRRRDEKTRAYNEKYGEGNWRLMWIAKDVICTFEEACRRFYEESYYLWLKRQPKLVDELCSYGECYDNAVSNISSGTDYTIQESYSTHIQDIAVRNALQILGRRFEGPMTRLLEIRSTDSNGFKFGPGNVPFYDPTLITLPSLGPNWAKPDSVEEFWQSNKWVQVRRDL